MSGGVRGPSVGAETGSVRRHVPDLDLFDGPSVETPHGLRSVDRDQIREITTTVVRCALTDGEAAALPAPSGPPVVELDLSHVEGPSLTARLGRLFGRPPWSEIDRWVRQAAGRARAARRRCPAGPLPARFPARRRCRADPDGVCGHRRRAEPGWRLCSPRWRRPGWRLRTPSKARGRSQWRSRGSAPARSRSSSSVR